MDIEERLRAAVSAPGESIWSSVSARIAGRTPAEIARQESGMVLKRWSVAAATFLLVLLALEQMESPMESKGHPLRPETLTQILAVGEPETAERITPEEVLTALIEDER